jgi:tetratricopeptide (TPR) repeat protein
MASRDAGRRVVLGVAVVLAALGGRAAADDTAAQVDARLAERLTRLAERHYRAGEYYRAISAYEELALFASDDATRLFAAVRIAMSYHHGHQLDDALAAYRTALGLVRDGDVAQALRIQLALTRVERSFEEPGSEALDAVAAELAPSTTAGAYRALALFELARIEGLAGRRDAARKTAAALPAACLPPAPGCSTAPLLRALDRPPGARRSPWLGVALSLVVPGAGSVYGGHLVDGLYSFALTTLSGLGALDVHDGSRSWTDQKTTFYGLAALAAIFYAGGAIQGYISVARHNALVELDARRALWRDTELPLPLEDFAPVR